MDYAVGVKISFLFSINSFLQLFQNFAYSHVIWLDNSLGRKFMLRESFEFWIMRRIVSPDNHLFITRDVEGIPSHRWSLKFPTVHEPSIAECGSHLQKVWFRFSVKLGKIILFTIFEVPSASRISSRDIRIHYKLNYTSSEKKRKSSKPGPLGIYLKTNWCEPTKLFYCSVTYFKVYIFWGR